MNESDRLAADLRQLADVIDRTHTDCWSSGPDRVSFVPDTLEEMLAIAKSIGGKWDKKYCSDASWFSLQQTFGRTLVTINIDRELVCRRVVETKTMPAVPEHVIPAQPERIEEVVSWECQVSILEIARQP